MPSSFTSPVEVFSKEVDGLNFISKDMVSKGWGLGGTYKVQGQPYCCTFWVPSSKFTRFKKDLSDSCLPFGLHPHYKQDYILILDKEDI